MFSSIANSPLLETIICLVLVYALLSLLVSMLTEIVNNRLNERGRQLYKGITRMFRDGVNINFGEELYKHPMVASIYKDGRRPPQYISNFMFSQALIDTIANHGRKFVDEHDIFKLFRAGVMNMADSDLRLLLINVIEKSASLSAGDDGKALTLLDQHIQQWYKDHMDRMSGWFKDLMRKRVFVISVVVTLVLNVNSIHLFKTLYSNPLLRSQVTPIAEVVADNYAKEKRDSGGRPTQDTVDVKALLDQLKELAELGIPVGWHKGVAPMAWMVAEGRVAKVGANVAEREKEGDTARVQVSVGEVLWYLVGLAITAFSISAGAPFWFDLLLKVVNVRRAGKKPE